MVESSTAHHDQDLPRMRGDGGTALLEFALVVPVLVIFLLGTFELGYMLKNQTTLVNSLRSAARSDANESSFTDRRWADYDALGIFKSMSASMRNMSLNRLIVYKALDANADPGPTCLTTIATNDTVGAGNNNASGVCNIYSKNQIANMVSTNFGASNTATNCTTGTTAQNWDRFYCPTSRANDLAAGLDTICFYAKYTYTYVTKIMPGTSRTISDKACLQVEPKS